MELSSIHKIVESCPDRDAQGSTSCAKVPRPSELTRAGRIGARPGPVVCERRAVGTTLRSQTSKSMLVAAT
jgi:hypothetical protein